MTIYINGIRGGLGQHLVQALVPFNGVPISSTKGAAPLYCDLRDLDPHAGNWFAKGDYFVFLAAMSKPAQCAADPTLARTVNVENTCALITRALERGAKVLFFSSDTVYGQQPEILREDAPLLGAEPYGMMKKEVEERFREHSDFKAFRLSYVVHKQDDFTRYLVGCAEKNTIAEIFQGYARNMIWIDDVTAAVVAALTKWESTPKAVNLAGPQCLSREAIAKLYVKTLLPELQYKVIAAPDGFFAVRPKRIHLDTDRLTTLLGKSATSIENALTHIYK